jgi:phosphonate transport system substrate-binding protein
MGPFSHERVSKAKTFASFRPMKLAKGKSFSSLPIAIFLILFLTISCTREPEILGSKSNPIKLYFVPSVDTKVIENNSKKFKDYLEKNTSYAFQISIPQSFIAVVEAFGTKRADVAALNTFGYALAHKKYGVEARLTVIRFGLPTYQSQFIVRADSKIKKIEDLNGKKMAFVDPASTSGYLIPLKALKDRNIKPKETVFAMKHDSVVSMVYQRQVDAGATFYSPKENNEIQDARRLVLTQYPDVEKVIRILQLSEPVLNDPVVFRKDLPEEMKTTIIKALKEFIQTPEGKIAFDEIYAATDLVDATDKSYEPTFQMYKDLGIDLESMKGK